MANVDKGQRLIKNTFIVGLGSIASKGIIFIMAPLFSRWLSVEDYGSFDLITTYVSLLLPFCTLSIAEAVFRFLLDDLCDENKKSVISSGLSLVFAGFFVFLAVYGILSLLVPGIKFRWEICVLLPAQILSTFFSEVTRGIKRVDLYSVFSLVSVILLSCLSTVFLLVFKWGLSGIVLGYAIAYYITAASLFFATKVNKLISVKYVSKKTLAEMLGYSWPLIPNSISWWVVNVSDRLIISNFLGLAANGIYAVANKIPAIVNVIFSVFHVAWVQSASESVKETDYSAYCNGVINKLIPFIFSASAVLMGSNFLFYQFIFDHKYAEAYYYSPILILAASVSCVGQFLGGIMIAKKESKQNGVTNMIAAVSNILINILMVKTFGLFAASVSTLGAYLIMVTFRFVMIRKHVVIKINLLSKLVVVAAILVFLGVYINNTFVNLGLLVVASALFFAVNWSLINRVFHILLKRK